MNQENKTYLDNLILGDIILKSILLFVIILGLIITNLDKVTNFFNPIINSLTERFDLLTILIVGGIIVISGLIMIINFFSEYSQSLPHQKYMDWLKNISTYPEYQGTLEHILGAGVIIHILWILIISIMLIYHYLPNSSITGFCFSALLWIIPVHIGGIFLAPRWEKTLVKKISNIVGLTGLLITFFISTITIEPFQTILQNIRIEWINQIFAILFMSSQR